MLAAQQVEASSSLGTSQGAWTQAGRRPPWRAQFYREKRASIRRLHMALSSACDPGGLRQERKWHLVESGPPAHRHLRF